MLFRKEEVKLGNIKRVETGIKELDSALFGGVPENSVVLVAGEAGTMKTTLCFHTLYHNLLAQKKGVYITLEESTQNVLEQMTCMGYDLGKVKLHIIPDTNSLFTEFNKLNKQNTDFLVLDVGNIRAQTTRMKKSRSTKRDWMEMIKKVTGALNDKGLLDVLVIDSLSALYTLSTFEQPRKELFQLFSFFRDLNCTCLFVSEIPPEENRFSEFGVEDYLADGIIRMKKVKRELKILGMLNIVKMRKTATNNDLFLYEYKNNNFRLFQKLD